MKISKHHKSEVYDKISKWWGEHNFPILDISFLPEQCFITSNETKDLHACFFYETDSDLCWFAFPVSNPDASKEEKVGSLEMLFRGMEEYAKHHKFKYIFTTSPNPVIQHNLTNVGFTTGDQNVNHYLKVI